MANSATAGLLVHLEDRVYLQVWVWYWDVVVLSLVLSQEFKPATDWTPEDLTHSKRQSTHEIVPGRTVPVPDLHRESSVPLMTPH